MSRVPEGRPPAPVVSLQFDRADRRYEPGTECLVTYRIGNLGDEPLLAVEHSILWYTEGKGEEDLGVHFFERVEDPSGSGTFGGRLPASPLSYEGVIVKVRWCIRVRIFFSSRDAVPELLGGGRDFVSEHVFEVGTIPPAAMNAGAQTA